MVDYNCWKGGEEEEDEDDEEDMDENYMPQKDALLFAIEVNDSMLSYWSEAECAAAAALKSVYQIMQQKIITNPRDMMGVLLFGTKKSKFHEHDEQNYGGFRFPHCYLLLDLNVPSAEDVKLLKDIVTDKGTFDNFLTPSNEEVSISDMLFCANQVFTVKAKNFGSRRLHIIASNDNPHQRDKTIRSQATVRAKDLYDLGIDLDLFPISDSNYEFDRTKFYDDIVYRDLSEQEESLMIPDTQLKPDNNGLSLLNKLISRISSKQVPKRALFSGLPFEIGPGFQISVNGYNLFQKQKAAKYSWVYDGGEELKIPSVEGRLTTEETNVPVDQSQITKGYKFGGSYIYFTSQEEKSLRFFEPPILRILGFKSKHTIPLWMSISKSTFIYPSEEIFVGSTRVFSALWKKLLVSELVAIAWYIPRINALPSIVAIMPSNKIESASGVQLVPAGLWLYTLPYCDDIRRLPSIPPAIIAPDVLIDETRYILQKLQLPGGIYDPYKYPNPTIQWHYRILQAMALGDDILEMKKEDLTEPRYRQIERRAGSHIKRWNLILEEQTQLWQKHTYQGVKTNLKRKGEKSISHEKNKKIKSEGELICKKSASNI